MKSSSILYDGFKFSFHRPMRNNTFRWRCTKYRCKAYLKCDANGIIMEKHLKHHHNLTNCAHDNNNNNINNNNEIKSFVDHNTIDEKCEKLPYKRLNSQVIKSYPYGEVNDLPVTKSFTNEYNHNTLDISSSSSSDMKDEILLDSPFLKKLMEEKQELSEDDKTYEDNDALYLTDPNELINLLYLMSICMNHGIMGPSSSFVPNQIKKIENELRRCDYIY
jgi:hypothetical protein